MQFTANANIQPFSWNHRLGVWTGTLKNLTKCLWRWEPDRRSSFFFRPPARLCAVTYMTERSLIVTLNNQFNNLQQQSSGMSVFMSALTCPSKHWHGASSHPFNGYSEKPLHFSRLVRRALGYGRPILILHPKARYRVTKERNSVEISIEQH